MLITVLGIVSIFCGFTCVMAAFYLFHRGSRKAPVVLGLLALVFLTLIPASLAVFFAATSTS